jgi:hypothetical protein
MFTVLCIIALVLINAMLIKASKMSMVSAIASVTCTILTAVSCITRTRTHTCTTRTCTVRTTRTTSTRTARTTRNSIAHTICTGIARIAHATSTYIASCIAYAIDMLSTRTTHMVRIARSIYTYTTYVMSCTYINNNMYTTQYMGYTHTTLSRATVASTICSGRLILHSTMHINGRLLFFGITHGSGWP